EGANHSRHVSQRRVLDPAFAQGHSGLALEVEDDEVLSRPEHLAEVVVSVNTNALRAEAALEKRTVAIDDFAFESQNTFGQRCHFSGKRLELLAQQTEIARSKVAHGLEQAAYIVRCEGFG